MFEGQSVVEGFPASGSNFGFGQIAACDDMNVKWIFTSFDTAALFEVPRFSRRRLLPLKCRALRIRQAFRLLLQHVSKFVLNFIGKAFEVGLEIMSGHGSTMSSAETFGSFRNDSPTLPAAARDKAIQVATAPSMRSVLLPLCMVRLPALSV